MTRAARRRWPVTAGAAVLLFTALAALLASQDWAPFDFERSADNWSAAHRPGGARAVAATASRVGRQDQAGPSSASCPDGYSATSRWSAQCAAPTVGVGKPTVNATVPSEGYSSPAGPADEFTYKLL
ncbi:hypothetical protein ACWC9T_13910 [Kitasatospora sp. NPDC001159]